MEASVNTILLDDIRIDGGTQPRAETNGDAIMSYAEELAAGAKFPPVVLFHDGRSYWLADGFHRFHAHAEAGLEEIPCEIKNGTQRDAIKYSLSANAKHGIYRSNKDKRHAVMKCLEDEEWAGKPQTEIGEMCCVSQQFVSKVLSEIGPAASYNSSKKKTATRNGTTYEMNTTNIGRQSASALSPGGATDEPPIEYTHTQRGGGDPEPEQSKGKAPEWQGYSTVMRYVYAAIATLESMPQGDPERWAGYAAIVEWINSQGGEQWERIS
uniref:Putative streptomycin biosynthesis operon possible regulatory protein n=1 Tax=uncultured marine virus TaxID=186617 RepID=A0A0F7L5X2_9VIRU|nr:putative streptomycin biosynthesis operon possible regulatory protein [uncultured marine virus]